MLDSPFFALWGSVTEITSSEIRLEGLNDFIGVSDDISITADRGEVLGEIVQVSKGDARAILFSNPDELRIGSKVRLNAGKTIRIGDHWLGSVVDYRGTPMTATDHGAPAAVTTRSLRSHQPDAHARRRLGERLPTGLMVLDTLLPICRGQRVGLFAGSGIGKSSLLLQLANGIYADRVVIALIGERSREINDFADAVFTAEMGARTTIIAATASDPPGAKKRAALCAMAAAEYFRDQGHHVLFLFDSITRFAEAHREVALMSGETPALNAFPPSTVRVIAELAERAGPGSSDQGDITAVFSVLVAGSDLEEPVADMIRGILDGHIVLSRQIAERGRYPAIDVLQSISRSLPGAATDTENAQIRDYKSLIATYESLLPMIRANLYAPGQDAQADRAIALFERLDGFVCETSSETPNSSFERLQALLGHTD